MVICQLCKNNFATTTLYKEHLNFDSVDLCYKYSADCPNGCQGIGSVLWREHRDHCAEQKIDCPYKKLECCSANVARKDISRHLYKDGHKHADSMVKHILRLSSDLSSLREESKITKEETRNDLLEVIDIEIEKIKCQMQKQNNEIIKKTDTKINLLKAEMQQIHDLHNYIDAFNIQAFKDEVQYEINISKVSNTNLGIRLDAIDMELSNENIGNESNTIFEELKKSVAELSKNKSRLDAVERDMMSLKNNLTNEVDRLEEDNLYLGNRLDISDDIISNIMSWKEQNTMEGREGILQEVKNHVADIKEAIRMVKVSDGNVNSLNNQVAVLSGRLHGIDTKLNDIKLYVDRKDDEIENKRGLLKIDIDNQIDRMEEDNMLLSNELNGITTTVTVPVTWRDKGSETLHENIDNIKKGDAITNEDSKRNDDIEVNVGSFNQNIQEQVDKIKKDNEVMSSKLVSVTIAVNSVELWKQDTLKNIDEIKRSLDAKVDTNSIDNIVNNVHSLKAGLKNHVEEMETGWMNMSTRFDIKIVDAKKELKEALKMMDEADVKNNSIKEELQKRLDKIEDSSMILSDQVGVVTTSVADIELWKDDIMESFNNEVRNTKIWKEDTNKSLYFNIDVLQQNVDKIVDTVDKEMDLIRKQIVEINLVNKECYSLIDIVNINVNDMKLWKEEATKSISQTSEEIKKYAIKAKKYTKKMDGLEQNLDSIKKNMETESDTTRKGNEVVNNRLDIIVSSVNNAEHWKEETLKSIDDIFDKVNKLSKSKKIPLKFNKVGKDLDAVNKKIVTQANNMKKNNEELCNRLNYVESWKIQAIESMKTVDVKIDKMKTHGDSTVTTKQIAIFQKNIELSMKKIEENSTILANRLDIVDSAIPQMELWKQQTMECIDAKIDEIRKCTDTIEDRLKLDKVVKKVFELKKEVGDQMDHIIEENLFLSDRLDNIDPNMLTAIEIAPMMTKDELMKTKDQIDQVKEDNKLLNNELVNVVEHVETIKSRLELVDENLDDLFTSKSSMFGQLETLSVRINGIAAHNNTAHLTNSVTQFQDGASKRNKDKEINKENNLNKQIKDMSKTYAKKSDLSSLKEQFNDMLNICNDNAAKVKNSIELETKMSQRVTALEKSNLTKDDASKIIKDQVDEQLQSLRNSVQDCHRHHLDVNERVDKCKEVLRFYHGVYLWRVSDLHNSIHKNRYSPSFYISNRGYKLQLRLVLSKDSSKISVYAYLVKGDYDDEVKWPFKKIITVRLLDQEHLGRHLTMAVNFNEKWDRCADRRSRADSTGLILPNYVKYQELLTTKSHLALNSELLIECFVDDLI